MKRVIPIVGFVILSGYTLALFGFTTLEAYVLNPIAAIPIALVFGGLMYALILEMRRIPYLSPARLFSGTNAANFLAVVIGALLTYTGSINLGLGAVTASCLVGLLAALITPKVAVPAYCGAFVGMSSIKLFASHSGLAVAATVSGVVYVLGTQVLNGFGGKLGTIAFVGTASIGWGLTRAFVITPTPDLETSLLIVFFATVAAVSTFVLSIHLKHGPVLASSVVGLLGGLILPALYPLTGGTLAVLVVCASYTGMSNTERCPHPWMMVLAGLITGVIFVYSTPLAGGAGGKLGTIAFGSMIAVYGICRVLGLLKQPEPVNAPQSRLPFLER